MKRALTIALILAAVAAAAWYAFGGNASSKEDKVFGQGAAGAATPIGDINANPEAWIGKNVVIEGEIIRMCAASGCWWITRDASGEMRAESSGAGFALPLQPPKARIRTAGKVIKSEYGDLVVAATGAELL